MDTNIIKKKLHQTRHVHLCTNGTKTMSTYYQKKNPLSIERENTGKKYRTFHLQNMFFYNSKQLKLSKLKHQHIHVCSAVSDDGAISV